MKELADLLPGTLEMLILKAVSLGPLHGYGVLLRIQQISRDLLQVEQGSLYPALHQMERGGLLVAEWREAPTGRSRKYYRLTARGRRAAASKRRQWETMAAAMRTILGDAGG